MKSGSGDDPFEDDEPESVSGSSVAEDNGDDGVPPYALRRGSVKEGRVKVPFWMRDEERLDTVKDEVEDILGYEVYMTDFKEAVVLEGLGNPERVAERLDAWGCEYA